jgi:ATP/maltotriose-dependent transcriptional regulator MalT
MLDESGARIILLIAPAGYGKTTLARQWLEDKPAAWYRGGPASADVAALAVGLASAAAEIVPGAGDRMRQRLRAADRPEEDAQVLGEMLAEDVAEWPEDAWLAIDDYGFTTDSRACQEFVESVAIISPLRVLVASRRRPSWATARRRLYGLVTEVGQADLTMSDDEALRVLSSRRNAQSLLPEARGWPAVIGLAALSQEPISTDRDLSADLYDFFAEELLQEITPDRRLPLCQLAISPTITDRGAAHVLGLPSAGPILGEATAAGILNQQSQGRFELHPLLREFLQRKLFETDEHLATSTIDRAAQFSLERREWNDAIILAEEFPTTHSLRGLIEAAWEVLLDEGRLATLSRLVNLALGTKIRFPLLDLVEAEIAFRQASYGTAESLALQAADHLTDRHLLVRAYTRAGQSAHLQGRDDDGLAYHGRARLSARSERDLKESLWGQFVCSIDSEEPFSTDVLRTLEKLGTSDPTDALRIAQGRMMLAVRNGGGVSSRLLSAIHLLPKVDDPLVRSSFLNVWVTLLVFVGKYDEALDVSDQQLAEADRFRLDFVLPHIYLRRAGALRGLRRFDRALDSLAEVERGQGGTDDFLTLASRSIRVGIYLAQGKARSALDIPPPELPAFSASQVAAELIGARALALAADGAADEARVASDRADSLSSAVEPRILSELARAAASVVTDSADARERTVQAFEAVEASKNIDSLVTAYRACPALLQEVSRDPACRPRLTKILIASHDTELGRGLGLMPSTSVPHSESVLTPREREVLDMLSEGLRNREIAKRLFISEKTVKVHVSNILRKTGARSRAHVIALVARGKDSGRGDRR